MAGGSRRGREGGGVDGAAGWVNFRGSSGAARARRGRRGSRGRATRVCRRNSTSRCSLTKAECSGSIIVIMSFLFYTWCARRAGPLTIRGVIDRTCMILPGTRRDIEWDKQAASRVGRISERGRQCESHAFATFAVTREREKEGGKRDVLSCWSLQLPNPPCLSSSCKATIINVCDY